MKKFEVTSMGTMGEPRGVAVLNSPIKGNNDQLSDDVTFETLLEMVGTKGKKNIIIFIICSIGAFIAPFHGLSYQFLGATPPHWCNVPELINANWTQEQIKTVAIPYNSQKDLHESCLISNYNYSIAIENGPKWTMENIESIVINNNTISCSSRYFNSSIDTIVTDWDLVCEDRHWYSTTQSIMQVGLLAGSLIFGYILDAFGRRMVTLVCSVLYVIQSFITPLSNGIGIYILFKCTASFLATGFYLGGFVLSMEFCVPAQRSYIGNFYPVPWAIGYMLVPIIAYFLRPWKLLQVALSVPSLLLLFNIWLLPESPRWLVLQGRFEEAYKILLNIAEANKRPLPEKRIMIKYMENIKKKSTSSSDVKEETLTLNEKVLKGLKKLFFFVAIKGLRLRSFIVFFCWFAVSMAYYGVSLGSENLGVNQYLFVFLGGLLELPAYLLLYPAVVAMGRKKTLIILYFMGAVLMLSVMTIIIAMEKPPSWLIMTLALIGKMAITAAFQLVYVYTAELYPTQLRSLAVGEASLMARMGSISSPYINDILGTIRTWIPSAIFGGVSLLAALSAVVLPETSDEALPDNLEFNKTDKKPHKEIVDDAAVTNLGYVATEEHM